MDSMKFVEQLGYLFYVVSPNKTTFETTKEVPDYIIQVIPHFILLIILESCLLLYKKKPTLRINDAIGSISQGLLQELARIVVRGLQLVTYSYVYDNWRLTTLPWDSPWTWWLCFLGVDFGYYWLHRASHEINVLWAVHQVHHSSEDYNLSTALRQSVFANYTTWMFYLPMALAVPTSVFLVHTQFNLLYQFWIHTEVITNLGPLECVINTASHHRVHHGRNRYCIDKNYAGTLIIWDRLFGTFQAEDEEVVYGLVHPINTFEMFYIQLCHYIHMWKTFWATEGFRNKLSVIFKGPGWYPGTPWHGNAEDIPDVKAPMGKFDPFLPKWCKFYVVFHFALLIIGYVVIAQNKQTLPELTIWSCVIYELLSLSAIGMLIDGRFYAPYVELLRCSLYLVMDYFLLPHTNSSPAYLWWLLLSLRSVFAASFIFWCQYCLRSVTVKLHAKTLEKGE